MLIRLITPVMITLLVRMIFSIYNEDVHEADGCDDEVFDADGDADRDVGVHG